MALHFGGQFSGERLVGGIGGEVVELVRIIFPGQIPWGGSCSTKLIFCTFPYVT